MAQATTSSSRTNPRLRGVDVTYVGGGPVEKMDLVIIVDGQDPFKRKSIAKTGTIACNIECPMSSTLTISIREKREVLFSMPKARVQTLLASIDTPLQDEEKTVNVKLFFSGILGTDAEKDAIRKRDADAARATAKARPTILGKLEKVRFLIDIIEPTGEAVGDLHSGVKGAFIAIGLLIQVCERQEACQKVAFDLTDGWDDLLSLTESAPVLREREESRKAVERLLEVIDEVSDYIINHTPTGTFGGLLSRKYNKKIEDFKEDLAKATRSLDLRINVEELKGINNIENQQMLDMLEPALRAHYKLGKEHMCLTGTRTRLLGKTSGWLRPAETSPSVAQPRVFWLCGTGGSGKSYVSNTVAETVNADADLDLSCFFCKRDDPDLSKPENFFRTLAFRIAQYYASYRTALVALLRSPEGAAIAGGGPRTQYKMMFEDLLPKIQVPARQSHVVVVDALDECGTPADQGVLAASILSLAKAAPWIKIFVTSRHVETIAKCFLSDSSMCVMTNINLEDDAGADIRHFIEVELKHMEKEDLIASASFLSSEEIDQLVLRAEGRFIWASTLFKHVRRPDGNPEYELRNECKGASNESLGHSYALYDGILRSAASAYNEGVDALHAILGMVFVTAGTRPLSVEALSCFLHLDERYQLENRVSVRQRIRPLLESILYEDESMHGAIRVQHPLFLDFFEERVTVWFSSGMEDLHRIMFRGCLTMLDAELQFNICQLEDSTLLNKDVPDLSDRITKSISGTLNYGSLFWFSHLSKSSLKPEEVYPLVEKLLCSRKFLFWLEVLSVLGAVSQGAAILHGCVQFFEGSPDIADVVSDLERFVQSSSEAMQSAPHIYLSALTWVPEETLTQKKIAAQFANLHWITRKEASWEGTRWVRSLGRRVYNVACSPDGRFVAAGMYDSVRILDIGTGEPAGEPLQCDGEVKSIRYSADGERVTIVSSETVTTWNIKTGATVRDPTKLNLDVIWAWAAAISPDGSLIACGSEGGISLGFFDAQTGAAVGEPLVGHTEWINSIAFSPDGQHVVSGSDDKTIRIWDVETRTAVGNPLEGHVGSVSSVSYSPDGRFIASGSWDDDTVRIWNAQTGAALFEPLRGHTNSVSSVAFSLDGWWVASGSWDGTIRIWDTNTGMAVGAPLQGHYAYVNSVAFLPDSRHIISGSEDTTVRIWDVGFSSTAGAASEGHSDSVKSVSFSPDGEHIASGSRDGTVRVWNTKTGAAIGGALEGHEDKVNSVCFSPDGLLIASASDDKTVRFWDAVTCAEVGEPLVGHTERICSIAFSPDGQHVVSGSWKTIRIWNAKTRTAVGKPLKGHGDWVVSVSYSPDGRCIVSGSEDGRVCLWNAQTGAALFKRLRFNPLRRGHSERVTSVVFSPSGQWIASGSWDETIRIWDAKTGAAIGDPLQCHSEVTSVAFSPDSRRLVSGSSDEDLIRIWDVETRAEIAEPLRGHSDWVNAVAFSPDGQHIASGSDDHTVRIWDAVDHKGTLVHWIECCARMNVEDGWVKDEEKLLLWIPHRYRELFRNWRLQICIQELVPWPVKPEVDLEKLSAYSGTGWTRFYEQ